MSSEPSTGLLFENLHFPISLGRINAWYQALQFNFVFHNRLSNMVTDLQLMHAVIHMGFVFDLDRFLIILCMLYSI